MAPTAGAEVCDEEDGEDDDYDDGYLHMPLLVQVEYSAGGGSEKEETYYDETLVLLGHSSLQRGSPCLAHG